MIELLDLGDELELDDPFAWLAVLADLAGKHSPRSSMVGKTQAPRRSWKMRASMRALIAARPFNAVVPVGYTQGTPTPLVVLLHGYTATGATQDAYFHLSELAQPSCLRCPTA